MAASLVSPAGIGQFVAQLAAALVVATAVLALFRSRLRRDPGRAVSLETLAIAGAGVLGLVFLFQNVLVHDALWYYGYLRSGLVDHDMNLYDEFVLRNPNGMYLPPPETPIFFLGTSISSLPLAIPARLLARALAAGGLLPGGDGYGPLELAAVTFSSVLLSLGGVAMTHRLARRVVPGPASAVAQTALLYGSPLAFFTFVWPGYPHPASVFLGAAFLIVWYRGGEGTASDEACRGAREGPASRELLLGLIGGALFLVHPQDILFVVLPLIDLALDLRRRGTLFVARSTLWIAAGFTLGAAPQIVAWLKTSGRPLPHVYAEIGDPFLWTSPALLKVLFSGYNGLLTWTPLCGAAIAGIFFLRRTHPRLFRALLLLVALQWWAIASYGYWWGGASMGSRYFLSAWPAFGIGLAVLIDRVSRRVGLLAAGLATVPFVYWTLLLMAQFRLEWIPHNRAPDFGAIVAGQLFEAPAVILEGLCGRFKWNSVLLLDMLRPALESGSAARMAATTLLALVPLAVTGLWVRWLISTSWRPRTREVCATAAIAMAAVTLAVGLVSSKHDTRRVMARAPGLPRALAAGGVDILPLEVGSSAVGSESPTAVSLASGRERAGVERLSLDLVSFMKNAEMRGGGETVALLEVQGAGCARAPFPVRAGIETAETAPDRYEERPFMRHDIVSTRPIQSWQQQDDSVDSYWGYAYLASWTLPSGCRPERVLVRSLRGPGTIELRGLVVSSTEVW